MVNISVIICTHNPRTVYLERVLDALDSQTLQKDVWELLLIDNASDRCLEQEIDLSWHPQARHIREEQLGLTPARLRGIKESSAEILVFVDDDNVLDANYLETALNISQNYACIGAWGGQIHPEFEESPPEWTKDYWWMLAVREFNRDQWSNLPEQWSTIPCGAGLCVRKTVATRYAEVTRNNLHRLNLDRKGSALTSGGDLDLALTSHEFNLGTGQFAALALTHLIPKSRLEEDYLLRLYEANGYSSTVLQILNGKEIVLPKLSWRQKLMKQYRPEWVQSRSRRFQSAFEKGKALACQEFQATETVSNPSCQLEAIRQKT